MNKERKIKKVEIEIFQDQEENLNNHFLKVLLASRNDEPIPNEDISSILTIISEVWENQDAYTFELIRQVYERFEKYDFKSKINVDDRAIKMDLRLLIETIIILTERKKYTSKKECVYDLSIVINNLYNDSLDKKSKKHLTPYKRYAIIGYIATKYGFHLFSGITEKPPTNKQIHKQVWDILKK